MKFIITEKQYIILYEQEPMSRGGLERFGYNWQKPETLQKAVERQSEFINNVSKMSMDDAVDIISGLIDGVPGIGNIVSAVIDVSHGIVYLTKGAFSNDTFNKVENYSLGILTLSSVFIPIGGNASNVVARQGIKSLIRKTPAEIIKIGNKLGITNISTIINKFGWKYNLLIVLCHIFGHELLEYIPTWIGKFSALIEKNTKLPKQVKDIINELISFLKEIKILYSDAIKIVNQFKLEK